jgi:hypothetical protein
LLLVVLLVRRVLVVWPLVRLPQRFPVWAWVVGLVPQAHNRPRILPHTLYVLVVLDWQRPNKPDSLPLCRLRECLVQESPPVRLCKPG